MQGTRHRHLKGKSTRKVPAPVKTDEIAIPNELKEMHQHRCNMLVKMGCPC
jgi:hypothetical protein